MIEVGVNAAMKIGAGYDGKGNLVKEVVVTEAVVKVPEAELNDEEKVGHTLHNLSCFFLDCERDGSGNRHQSSSGNW